MRCVRRIGASNSRVKRDKIYELNNSGYIKDDNGANMKVCLDKPGYWELCVPTNRKSSLVDADFAQFEQRVVAASITSDKLVGGTITGRFEMNQLTAKRKLSTIEITTATYINGENASSYTNDDLVEAIQSEQEKINTLKNLPEKVREQSAAIKALIEKHETNITKLVEIIDANHKYH